MLDLLAETAAANAGGSELKTILPWITSFVVAVVGLVLRHQGMEKAKLQGRKEERDRLQGNVTIDAPIPEITTREAPRWADATSTDEKFQGVAEDIDQIHTRLNALFRVVNTLEGQFSGMNENVGRLLDIALNRPPGTTASRQRKPN